MGTPVPNRQVETISAWSSEVKTYTLSPEEIARRYGPPSPRREDSPFHARLMQAVNVSKNPEAAAELLNITVGRLNQYLGVNGIRPRWERKDDENMAAIQMTETEARDKLPPEIVDKLVQSAKEGEEHDKNPDNSKDPPAFYENPSGRRFTAERIALAEEALSRDEYVRLKGEGVSDSKIIETHERFSFDLLGALKKKWGINIVLPGGPPKKNQDHKLPVKTEKPGAQPSPAGLTISQAMELRDELVEDVDDYNHIIHQSKEAQLSERVIMAIGLQRDILSQSLDRINEVFETTVVQL